MAGGANLARRTLGPGSLFVFAVGASSPLTVLVGGIVVMYALTGVRGVPLAYLVVMVVLAVLMVGYLSVARHVVHSAPAYAQLARGFGPAAGVAGAAVALVGYSAIQISLFGLVGERMTALAGGSWWMWAAVAWVIVAVLGWFRGAENAKVLGALLVVELATITLFDVAAFSNPARDVESASVVWQPSALLTTGVSGVLAFAMASFTGVESPAAFGEESRSPRVTRVATFAGVAFLGVFYAMSAWAYAIATGPSQVVAAANDPARGPFGILDRVYGPGMEILATGLLVTSVLAALSAFHGTVARYIFALAREHALPAALARVSAGGGGGAPVAASTLQTLVAGVVVAGFAVAGADPLATMFVWLSTIGAVSVLLLLTACSVSAAVFFAAGRGGSESFAVRQVLPITGGVLGFLVLVFMLSNLHALLGTPEGSQLPLLVVAIVVGMAVVGLFWGLWLRARRPEIYRGLGHGAPDPLTVQDARLSELIL